MNENYVYKFKIIVKKGSVAQSGESGENGESGESVEECCRETCNTDDTITRQRRGNGQMYIDSTTRPGRSRLVVDISVAVLIGVQGDIFISTYNNNINVG